MKRSLVKLATRQRTAASGSGRPPQGKLCPATGHPMAETAGQHTHAATNPLLPAQTLEPGELVMLMVKPSLLTLILQPLGVLVGLAVITLVGAYLAETIDQGFGQREVYGVGLGLMAMRIFWQFLDWLGTLYVMTDRRMIIVGGILRPRLLHVPLAEIRQVELTRGQREQWTGLGTLVFTHSGGRSGWWMIAWPQRTLESVQFILQRYRS